MQAGIEVARMLPPADEDELKAKVRALDKEKVWPCVTLSLMPIHPCPDMPMHAHACPYPSPRSYMPYPVAHTTYACPYPVAHTWASVCSCACMPPMRHVAPCIHAMCTPVQLRDYLFKSAVHQGVSEALHELFHGLPAALHLGHSPLGCPHHLGSGP